MASNKPKNPQVGVIDCPFHDDAMIVQARVMQSLPRGGKFYIACQSCGLIMPTLPNFQTWIKNNARFNQDISGGISKPVSVTAPADTNKSEQQQAEPEKQSQKAATTAAKTEPEAKPEKIKRSVDEEMGF